MDSILSVWDNLWAELSWPFTVVIVALMVVDITTHYFWKGRHHKQLSGLMTGVGILGTFFGVVVGLQDFDPNKISDSIGPLLDGLKVSFSTSVMGLGAAVFTEIVEKVFPNRRARLDDPIADSMNQHMLD